MVLMAIVGELGGGKTLFLTYLVWNNYYYKDRLIYSNYNIFGIPFTPVKTIDDLKIMIPLETQTAEQLLQQKEIFFAGDELWRWIDSRCTLMESSERKAKKISNKLVTDILLASRKAFVTIAYTTQSFDQVDKRIRNITDFVCYPVMSFDGLRTTVSVFRGSKPTIGSTLPPVKFYNEPIYAMYNTYERVQPLLQGEISKETMQEIKDNPAWIKYLKDRKVSDANMLKESEKIQKLITRPTP